VRNDALSVDGLRELAPQAIVISPGPCTPARAGISVEVVRALSDRVPILGVCLGHQAIGEALGGTVARSPFPVHGMRCRVHHDGSGLFAGLANPLWAGRYHSLCVVEDSLPETLRVTARSDDGGVMAVAHVTRPLCGVQFHPESVLTESGHRLLSNFLTLAGVPHVLPASGDYNQTIEPADNQTLFSDAVTPITW
jgi:anthranilate synthase/aminodeoxychorismate synthase-like glutamine amidotransferase